MASTSSPSSATRTQNRRVLLVDDSPIWREFLIETMGRISGVDADVATGGFEALKLLPRARYDLIITDLQMPDINGLELINFVKKSPNYGRTPLFILTSQAREQERDRGRRLGASEYLVKPLEPELLMSLVRRYLFG